MFLALTVPLVQDSPALWARICGMLQDAAPRLLTVAEAAEILRVSEDTIRRRVAAAELPAYRTGSGPRCPLRIKAGDLSHYIFGEDECRQ